ncbi:MAG TPA: cysteine-rich CWC family protein [Mucilaginibacter sp.]|nr:cysteine-rich CWC family protein [Mucilaginibacter sp.]
MHPHKHEIIQCERCRFPFECKANAVTKCQCTTVQLTLNETQYISEQYDGCLCAGCLVVLKDECQTIIKSTSTWLPQNEI